MAIGDAVVQVLEVLPPGTLGAAPSTRAGGSTPAEDILVHAFDASTIEYMDFLCKLEGYDGGGVTFTLPWSATSATAAETRWGVAVRALPDDAEDIDAAHTYVYVDVDDTAPSASGELSYPTVALGNGAPLDNWAEGELAIVRVRRNATHANDDMTGDAELWGVPLGLETA